MIRLLETLTDTKAATRARRCPINGRFVVLCPRTLPFAAVLMA